MKKIIFSIVGSMLISLCVVQAQQTDSEAASKSKTKQNKHKTEQSRQNKAGDRSQDQKWQQQSDRGQGQNAYANEGMVVIEKDELPASLKQKLQSDEYAGWENGTIYHNTNTGEYVIAPKAYRFDSKGNEMEMGDASQGYSSRDRSGRYSEGQQNNQYRTREGQQDNQNNQYRTRDGQQDNQNNHYRTRDGQQQSSSQQQARDQAGEIPTSASERADNTGQQTDNANQQRDAQNRTGDQSSTGNQSSRTSTHGTPASSNEDQTSTTQQTGDQASRDRQQSQGYRTDRSQSDAQGQPGQTSGNQYRTEDMVEVQTEQIPASLRRTLRESQYKGWEENGTLYQDPSTKEYVLVMDKTDDSSQSRGYRFDKNGQLKEDDGSTQSKNRQ